HQSLVPCRLSARGGDIGLRTRPPSADDLVTGIGNSRSLLDGRGIHHAPAPKQDVIGPVLPNLQPLRLLLHTRVRDRDQQELEAVQLRALLQQRNRLLAVGAIVVDERDLLALELFHATELFGDVLDRNVRSRPIRAKGYEIPGEYRAVAAIGAAVAAGQQWDLVAGRFLGEREGNAGRERREIAGAGWAFALEALIAFNALVGRITGFAFLENDLHPV